MKSFAVALFTLLSLSSVAYAKPIHLKVEGEGFFVMTDSEGSHFYTSDMSFYRNKDGDLVTFDRRLYLQGRVIGDSGTISSFLSVLNLANISSSPSETHKVSISANLDSASPIRTGIATAFDATSFQNAYFTSDFNASSTIYDSLGNPRIITIYFSHTGANRWDFHVLSDLSNLDPTYSRGKGTFVLQEGSIVFNSVGLFEHLDSAVGVTPADQDGVLSAGERITADARGNIGMIPWGNGANAVKVGNNWNYFGLEFGQGFYSEAVMTQFTNPSAISTLSQDGRSPGTLMSIDINESGTLIGNFSSETSRSLYQIPLAIFPGEDFLKEVSPGVFVETEDSGYAQIGQANSAGRGAVKSIRN